MQITSTPYTRPMRAETPTPPPPPENPGTPPETPDLGDKLVENLLSSPEFAKQVAGKIGGNGSELTITVDGEQVLKVSKEGPSLMERTIRGGQLFISAAAEEASKLVQADPAFAFKESALGVKTQVYSGLPREVQTVADKAFLPMLRVVALLLDAKKLRDTLANKDAPLTDKIVDGVHVATDVVGLVGALGDKLLPALAGVAPTFTAIGLAGDIAAYSYHVLSYLKERGQVQAVPPTA